MDRDHVVVQNQYIEMIPDAKASTYSKFTEESGKYHNIEEDDDQRDYVIPTILIPCAAPLNYSHLPKVNSRILEVINSSVKRRAAPAPITYHFSECSDEVVEAPLPEGVYRFSEAYSFTECDVEPSSRASVNDDRVFEFSCIMCHCLFHRSHGFPEYCCESRLFHTEEEQRAGKESQRQECH